MNFPFFEIEQFLFDVKARGIPRQRTVGTDDAVARNKDQKRIVMVGHSDRAACTGLPTAWAICA
jgi:hypothetical protein